MDFRNNFQESEDLFADFQSKFKDQLRQSAYQTLQNDIPSPSYQFVDVGIYIGPDPDPEPEPEDESPVSPSPPISPRAIPVNSEAEQQNHTQNDDRNIVDNLSRTILRYIKAGHFKGLLKKLCEKYGSTIQQFNENFNLEVGKFYGLNRIQQIFKNKQNTVQIDIFREFYQKTSRRVLQKHVMKSKRIRNKLDYLKAKNNYMLARGMLYDTQDIFLQKESRTQSLEDNSSD